MLSNEIRVSVNSRASPSPAARTTPESVIPTEDPACTMSGVPRNVAKRGRGVRTRCDAGQGHCCQRRRSFRRRRRPHVQSGTRREKPNSRAARMGLRSCYQNSDQRTVELFNWLHRYNLHRPHGSLKAKTPIGRLGLSEDNLSRLHSWYKLPPLFVARTAMRCTKSSRPKRGQKPSNWNQHALFAVDRLSPAKGCLF